MKGKIHSINISTKKGIPKTPIEEAVLQENFGMAGDVHAGEQLKQVSLLSWEAIERQNNCPKIKSDKLKPGDFAENITTVGLDLSQLKIKDRIIINENIILEISQIGKECHAYCSIYKKTGDCIMPREGIFARVITGGQIKLGDELEVITCTK